MSRNPLLLFLLASYPAFSAVREVAFSQSAGSVAAYDFVEVSLRVSTALPGNPFTGAVVTGEFGAAGSSKPIKVDGFCDSSDGTLFRIRFMPSKPGDYTYSVKYAENGFEKSYEGTFHANAAGRRGPIRVDPEPSVALHLGRHAGALLLQWDDGLLADGLAGRAGDR